MKKVFFSQMMHGLSATDVESLREEYKPKIEEYFGEDIEYIDNLQLDLPESTHILTYLGNSISMMKDADVVVFAPDSMCSDECTVEKLICKLYDIRYYDIIDNIYGSKLMMGKVSMYTDVIKEKYYNE